MKGIKKALLLGVAAICVGGAAYKRSIRMPWQEYAQYARRMAELDDAIGRNELDGNRIDGKVIVFPPKSESVEERYHFFLKLNRRKSRNTIRSEIERMEQRLEESKQYENAPKEDLEVEWVEADRKPCDP